MQKLGRFQTKPIFDFKTQVFTHDSVEHTPWFHKLGYITEQKQKYTQKAERPLKTILTALTFLKASA